MTAWRQQAHGAPGRRLRTICSRFETGGCCASATGTRRPPV